jgi:GT2 family glycosyltransferase
MALSTIDGEMDSATLQAPPSAHEDMADGIAVVVLTHNRVDLLRKCVENVLMGTSQLTREIIIWDNASTDGTADYLQSLDDPRVRVVVNERNIGQNGYARAFRMTTSPYLVELDDDVVEAPREWDATLLAAFKRLPKIGFLAADLVDDPNDRASYVRYNVHQYRLVEENGVRLLRGPAGGGCAITSRELSDRVGGFRESKKHIFWLEDETYIKDIEKIGYECAVLADLKVHHTGGPYYSSIPEEKTKYWERRESAHARRQAIKRVLVRFPFVRRLNARYRWFEAPS